MKRKTVCKKFTLVELLIVISIIVILAGLLLPSLGRARDAGKRITCANKMKQLGLTVIEYTNDFNFYFPIAYLCYPETKLWDETISELYPGKSLDYNDPSSVFYCPKASVRGPTGIINRYYISHSPVYWGPMALKENGTDPVIFTGSSVTRYLPGKITQFVSPTRTVLLADSSYVSDTRTPNTGYIYIKNVSEYTTLFGNRHGGFSNVFFVDGHTEAISTAKLNFWAQNASYALYKNWGLLDF